MSNKTKIGKGVKIGKYCIIDDNVIIGDNTVIKNFVEIRCEDNSPTIIGSGCLIESGVLLDGKCEIKNGAIIGPGCELKNNVIIEEGVVLQGRNRIAKNCIIKENSLIKYGSILTSNVLVGKNVFIGPNVIFLGSELSRSATHAGADNTSTIGDLAFVGAGTKVNAGINICNNAIIGAMSFVNKEISEAATYVGCPIRRVG